MCELERTGKAMPFRAPVDTEVPITRLIKAWIAYADCNGPLLAHCAETKEAWRNVGCGIRRMLDCNIGRLDGVVLGRLVDACLDLEDCLEVGLG